MKLNLGCGRSKLEGYTNIDADPTVLPDLVLDFSSTVLPFKDATIDEIVMTHVIEHLKREQFPLVIGEVNRVLKMEGLLIVAYPDAERILTNYLNNKMGMRQYWEMTIFGRGLTRWDRHQCLINTEDFVNFLREYCFGKIKVMPEIDQSHNTIIEAAKLANVIEMTDLLKKELAL